MSVFIEATAAADEAAGPGRWTLIRRVIVFQIKLALDGFRDLVMSPLSIVAGIVGVLIGGREPDWAFRRLMRFGRETDRWIDLFDARDALDERHPERTVDAVLSDLEDVLRRDYASGGVTARSLAAAEAKLEKLRRECRRGRIRR